MAKEWLTAFDCIIMHKAYILNQFILGLPSFIFTFSNFFVFVILSSLVLLSVTNLVSLLIEVFNNKIE